MLEPANMSDHIEADKGQQQHTCAIVHPVPDAIVKLAS